MRPLELTVEGLRSWRHQQTVSFEGLGLFALIGDTGAGKSSLIEAMCLALYGAPTWTDQQGRLATAGGRLMVVRLRFAVGADVYEVTRRYGASSKHALVGVSDGVKAVRVDGARAVTDAVQRIVGLDKRQFVSAVVLPQGRFQQLLTATPGERTGILKGIFRLGDLDAVRSRAVDLRDQVAKDVALAEGRRLQLGSPHQALEEAQARVAAARDAVTVLEQAVQEAARAQALVDEARGHARAVAQALDAVGPAPCNADDVAALLARRAALTDERAGHQQAAAAAADAAAAATERARALVHGFARRDDAVAALLRVQRAADELPGAIDAARAAAARVAELRALPPPAAVDPALDEAARLAGDEQARADRVAAAARHDAQTMAGRVADWRATVERLVGLTVQHGGAAAEAAAAEERHRAAEQVAERAHAAHTAALEAVDAARTAEQAAAVAAHLHPGHDCPVCHRPLPEGWEAPVSPALAAVQEHERRCRATAADAARDLAAARSAADRATERADAAAAAREDGARHEAAARVALTPVFEAAGVAVPADADAALDLAVDAEVVAATLLAPWEEQARAADGTAHEAGAAARRAHDALAAARARLEAAHEAHRRDVQAAVTEHQRCDGTVTSMVAAVLALPPSWRPAEATAAPEDTAAPEATAAPEDTAAPEPAGVAAAARTIAARLADALAEAEAALTLHRTQQEAATAATRAAESVEARLLTEVEHPADRLRSALHARSGAVAAVRAAAQAAGADAVEVPVPARVDDGRSPLDDLPGLLGLVDEAAAAAAATARAAMAQLRAVEEEAGAVLTHALVPAGVASLDEAREVLGHRRAAVGEHLRAVERLEGDVRAADALDEVLMVGRPYLANLGALAELLNTSGFPKEVVGERTAELLVEGSRILQRMSGGRFGFGTEFAIVDLRTGTERAADTLSGGEQFQASLALALALVEIATRQGGTLDAVFIDEGFGSLDAASLDAALVTLEGVAAAGRTVGLVSHLRQVAEYVEDVLLVTCDDVRGSTVTRLDTTAREDLLAEDARHRMTG